MAMDCREDKEKIRMLFTLLLTALTATSGEDTHYSEKEGALGVCVSLLPSGLAGSGSQEQGASLTWTGHKFGCRIAFLFLQSPFPFRL